jgi:hypothetical protein
MSQKATLFDAAYQVIQSANRGVRHRRCSSFFMEAGDHCFNFTVLLCWPENCFKKLAWFAAPAGNFQ